MHWQERFLALGYCHFEPVKADREKDIGAVYFRQIRKAVGRRKQLAVTLYRNERGMWMVRVDSHMKLGRIVEERVSWLGPFTDAAIYTGVFEIEIAVVDEWEKAVEAPSVTRC